MLEKHRQHTNEGLQGGGRGEEGRRGRGREEEKKGGKEGRKKEGEETGNEGKRGERRKKEGEREREGERRKTEEEEATAARSAPCWPSPECFPADTPGHFFLSSADLPGPAPPAVLASGGRCGSSAGPSAAAAWLAGKGRGRG